MALLRKIASLNVPVIFHTGILWDGNVSSSYNRPINWEALIEIEGIRFSMGHCSWPWVDECIAVYGKFLHYYNTRISSEMFFDITPGTPEIYRRDLLTKLFTVGYDVENNIMFGTDSLTNDYNPSWLKKWLTLDNKIMDDLNISSDVRKKIYEDNFMRFLNGEDVSHVLPHINK
jgi:predicted TIM-barrel fold metal-dependent hydrolase